MSGIDRVLGNIYVGPVQPIIDHVPLKVDHNISHILSVMKFQILPEYLIRKSYTLKNIPIDDDDTTDVLQFINETNTFLDHCLFPHEPEYNPTKVNFKKKPQKNGVYVHCHAGVSRSVTFVVAYLMYRYGLNLKSALYAVQRKHPGAQPNDNFMEQLKIYQSMGSCYVDNDYQAYKVWKLANSVKEDVTGETILAQEETFKHNDQKRLQEMTPEEIEKVTVIRCKKCRQHLALSTSFIEHEPPSKESMEGHFIRRAAGGKRIIDIQQSQEMCSHFFVEPLNWMKQELRGKQELEGKFSCPTCTSKVGAYNWKGSRCSCGKWMIPAIYLRSAKLDQVAYAKKALPNVVGSELVR
ncbi:LANO_0F17238g1_1 [Lachancea nothofagi CBS 11611]|uniref:protein-tyrosine-phosphatase n=1 Tax=Lachancea nothofagi CBS 11611 TaxID=1266666 RepID=A0A1G4KCZ3_9SACH|nr:LANO_0F17238g1_1 [Lachancea nothofagi CBS 11611]